MSLKTYSAEDHARLLGAEERNGNAFNAHNVTILLSNLVLWPTGPVHLFFRFYSQEGKERGFTTAVVDRRGVSVTAAAGRL